MPVSFSFSNDELDELEEYELNFDCNEWYDDEDLGDDATIQQLMYPFSKHEPNLTEEELQRLDAYSRCGRNQAPCKHGSAHRLLKHAVWIQRSYPRDLSGLGEKSWMVKVSPYWLRRSRLVAREFAWMDAERESLFLSSQQCNCIQTFANEASSRCWSMVMA